MNRMNHVIKSTLLILPAILMLSGCLTYLIAKEPDGYNLKKWKSDEIIGLSMAEDVKGTKGWVFIGKQFNYLLTKNADNIANFIKKEGVDRHNIKVVNDAIFTINEHHGFNGNISITYRYNNENDKKIAMDSGFNCAQSPCTYFIDNLDGTLHQKNKDEDQGKILKFNSPFTVKFYRYTTSGKAIVKNVLLPFAITIDIVTAPLQLLGLVIMLND